MTLNASSPKKEEWSQNEVVKALQQKQPMLWFNPYKKNADELDSKIFTEEDLEDAAQRLERFRPFFMKAFPETVASGGLIESPLVRVDRFQARLSKQYEEFPKNLWVKCDSHLPISGSIKARGGIYEVLKHAETLAIANGLVDIYDDYSIFADENLREFFSNYSIAVGSTGNLGLSIGIISTVLGFKVKVHMSSDAKAWKKDMLRAHGAEVYEYDQDYSAAVDAGRKVSDADPNSYFVDDEHSRDLFLGYTVAARRIKKQLEDAAVEVREEKPLHVDLHRRVGGGAGDPAYSLKEKFA